MAEGVQTMQTGQDSLIEAIKVAQETPLQQAPNGIRYASYGENNLASGELDRIVQAVPALIAPALVKKAYYFVPLTMAEPDDHAGKDHRGSEHTMISPAFTPDLAEAAICHRNVPLGTVVSADNMDGVFISTRLLNDRFALSFEFFINVGHAFVETVGVPAEFNTLLWEQATRDVRGETSLDAWEARAEARTPASLSDPKPAINEKAKSEFLEAAFADAMAIYLLSLSVDFNYSELREREYPLLAPTALAERLRLAAKLFPPNPGYEFSIRYKGRA
jgi:hypothetical protein